MTLRAIAGALIGEFIRAAKTTEELNLREEAILRALDEVYDRRFLEIKTFPSPFGVLFCLIPPLRMWLFTHVYAQNRSKLTS